jgi:hypothetical protein
MAIKFDEQALTGLIFVVLIGGGWLYFSGHLDSFIEAHQRSGLPPDQVAFIRMIDDARHRWQDAPNDIQREPMLGERDTALCRQPMNVTSWTGRVDHVGTYVFGSAASFTVNFASHITLGTEGDLDKQGTKIERGTPLFDVISKLAEGQAVTFSGHFISGYKSCLRETSITTGGSVTDPSFVFAFTEVSLDS